MRARAFESTQKHKIHKHTHTHNSNTHSDLRIRRQIDLRKIDGANRLARVDVRNQLGGHIDADRRLRLLGGAACASVTKPVRDWGGGVSSGWAGFIGVGAKVGPKYKTMSTDRFAWMGGVHRGGAKVGPE